MQERLNALLKTVNDSDKMELVMLNNAFVAATNSYKANASSESVKEWRKLKEDLAALLDHLEEKYDMNVTAPEIFTSKIKVWEFLVARCWNISKSQFYQHCKEGLLRPAKKDGKYHLKAVEKYAAMHVVRADTGQKESDREIKMREDKLEVALERERVGLEREQFELDAKKGKFIPRAEFELAVVARAVAFMAHLNHSVQASVQDWIHLVEGNQSRAPELVEAISREIEQRMGDFAADAEFDVILEA